MSEQLRILMVEDAAADAELALRELGRARIGYDARRVETAHDYRHALREFMPEVILSDFSMPKFDGMRALAMARENCPGVPFIFVSGTIGEEHAIQALKNGATDYVLKNNLLRLPSAVERAINEARARAERERAATAHEQTCKRLEDIASSLPSVLWSVAVPSLELLYVSPAVAAVYRRSAEDFYDKRMPWTDPIHPDDRSRVITEWDTAIQCGRLDCEHRIVLASKEVRWIHSRGRRARDTSCGVDRIDGITEDITERRQQQQKITRLSRILVKAARRAIAGKQRISPRVAALLARCLENPAGRLSHEQLSDRELQILLLIGNGRSIKQIAGDLSISVNTVHTHRTRMLKKMGMRTNAALIRYAVEHGLVE